MNNRKQYNILWWLLPAVLLLGACHSKGSRKFALIPVKMGRGSVVDKYPKVPQDEILHEIAGNRLYSELKERYTQSLTDLRDAVAYDAAKLVVVIMTPETGKSITMANSYGIPYIKLMCSNLNIECVDLTPALGSQEAAAITQMPFDGHWSKAGAALIADQLAPVVDMYTRYRTTRVFPDSQRPKLLGDLEPNANEVIDDEQNLHYRLRSNSEGLRMDHDLKFPKTKQTILFLGDDQLFSPFLDNEFTATSLLQKRYPDKEIVNAGCISYTMEDYLTLYKEKARYMEPDVVVVCTNGGDILDYYFSQRNRFSRTEKSYRPSELERKFYEQLYN